VTAALDVWCALVGSPAVPEGRELGTASLALMALISTAHNGGARSTATEHLADGNGRVRTSDWLRGLYWTGCHQLNRVLTVANVSEERYPTKSYEAACGAAWR
jgi:hypothetical protein